MKEYFDSLMQYENRLSKVIQETIKLQTVKANMFKGFRGEDKSLTEERKKILELIEKTQRLYLSSGKIETRVYENKMRSYTERLTEIEERLAGLQVKKETKRFKRT